jgi:hypothetical protein
MAMRMALRSRSGLSRCLTLFTLLLLQSTDKMALEYIFKYLDRFYLRRMQLPRTAEQLCVDH